MTMNIPEGVSVCEQWAVHSDDGHVYRVEGDSRELAERNAAMLRAGEPDQQGEPGAAAARRFVMVTPDGEVATSWRWWL